MSTRKLVLAGFFAAFGVLLPQIFHIMGGLAGPVFLPMHIPVLLAGFICGPVNGAIVGALSVVLSNLFTGMPGIPMLFIMIIELPVYGYMAGLLYNKLKKNVFISLAGAMIIGRLSVAALIPLYRVVLGINLPPKLSIVGIVSTGLPGILIQLIFIPSIILSLKKLGVKHES